LLEKTFRAKTFPRDKSLVLTIKSGGAQEVGQTKEPKPVVKFLEDLRAFVLNNASYEALAKAHGTKSITAYVGAVVELSFSDSKSSPGGVPGTILLKVVKPAKKS
jgi:hypothetical protein